VNSKIRSVITGVGRALPSCVVTNQEIAESIQRHGGEPSDNAWVVSHTGIMSRHIADSGEPASTLGATAAAHALERAGKTPADVDEIIVATCTPDYKIPSTACLIHALLGCRKGIPATDLNAGCTGFIYALRYADLACRSEGNRVLVIGTEVLSSITNPGDRDTRPLFGDGAGAVFLEPMPHDAGILGFVVGADGTGHDLLKVPAGGSALPATTPGLDPKLLYLRMNGREVYRFATRIIVEVVNHLCQRCTIAPADINVLIPHQANWRIIESAARTLDFPLDRIPATIQQFGNTSAASIPIGLSIAHDQGYLRPGYWVVVCGFGAGLTWGGAIMRWV